MDFEEQKRGLMFALTNTLRSSRLVDMVNGQEAAAAFAMNLNRHQAGQPIDLGPFYEWLVVEKKLQKDVVAETLLFLKSREARYQVELVLPKEVLAVDEASRQKIVQEFVARGASTSGIYQGLVPKEVSSSKKAAPGPAPKDVTPKRKTDAGASKRNVLLAVLAVVAVGGVGLTAWVNSSAPVPARPLTLTDEGGLPCVSVKANDGYALCRIKAEDAKRLAPADLKKMAGITKAAAARAGHGRALHVFTLEDNQHVGSF